MNSDPNDPLEGFNTFFSDREFFKHIEIGWTNSSQEAYFMDNLHLTLWHADEREEKLIDDGWGALASLTKSINDQWLVFMRAGYSEDGGSLMHKSVSIGGSYHESVIGAPGSQLGFGLNWGEPNDNLFGDGLDDQYAMEVYYRWQLSREISITPDVQLLIDPALNPEEDNIWVIGLRTRIAL